MARTIKNRRKWQQRIFFFIIAITITFLYFFILKVEQTLESHLRHGKADRFTRSDYKISSSSYLPVPKTASSPPNNTLPSPSESLLKGKKYIIFQYIQVGQGLGNNMNGLLAAHMLGKEFNRTVCVDTMWKAFHAAFQSLKQPECKELLQRVAQSDRILGSISIFNYANAPNECKLQQLLKSRAKVLRFTGNTYPRWSITPPGLWDQHYVPTEALRRVIPYKKPPSIVVHLRQGDNSYSDRRKGLDDATLAKLKDILTPKKGEDKDIPYLVTNRVNWYEFFEGWDNPGWHRVVHSALGIDFNKVNDQKSSPRNSNPMDFMHSDTSVEKLQMYCDWYTILNAKMVYHTYSDFSLSAIHFKDVPSKSLMGLKNDGAELKLEDEPWRVDPPCPRVVDRQGKDLKNCLMSHEGISMAEDFLNGGGSQNHQEMTDVDDFLSPTKRQLLDVTVIPDAYYDDNDYQKFRDDDFRDDDSRIAGNEQQYRQRQRQKGQGTLR